MTVHAQTGEDAGHARYTYRVRVSSRALAALEAEWARCRWLWNECVARSKKAHREGEVCGPAALDRMLTEARRMTPWLREGSSVPQQQLIRDFGKSRAKALKDIKDGVAQHRRAGMPRWKRKRQARPSLNYTRRGFSRRNRKRCPLTWDDGSSNAHTGPTTQGTSEVNVSHRPAELFAAFGAPD